MSPAPAYAGSRRTTSPKLAKQTLRMTKTRTSTPAQVAATATQHVEAPEGRIALLGIFGSEDNLSALVQFPGGRTRKVTTGQRLGRSEIIAIDKGGLLIRSGNTTVQMTMPGG